jgi:hypothetical protein
MAKNRRKRGSGRAVPQAEDVAWVGLCPCGCGAYKAVLLDGNDRCMATFGWDEEGWGRFMARVMRSIARESNEETPAHETTH